MTPLPRLLAGWTALSLAFLGMLSWGEAHGFVSARVTSLWARAIVLLEGQGNFRATDAFAPPIPDVLTLLVHLIAGGSSIPTPFLLASGLGAMLAILWCVNLRGEGGYGLAAALLVTALLVLNPFFLRAVSDGPGTVLLLVGVWLYARGLVRLRLSGSAPDMMKVAAGLLLALLSHHYGLLVCVAAIPFIVVAARPGVLAVSPVGYLVATSFPVLAAIGGLAFVSVISDRALPGPPTYDAADTRPIGAHVLMLAGPMLIIAMAVFRTIRKAEHVLPLLAAMGTALGAYGLNAIYRVEVDPTIAAAALLPIAAVAMRYWPPVEMRMPTVTALLALGIAVPAISVPTIRGSETERWLVAMLSRAPVAPPSNREVAAFLRGKDAIMVDAERHPEIVTAIGGVSNLLLAGRPAYDIALRGGQIRADFIVVPRDAGAGGLPDRLLQGFPQLASDTLTGFSQVYQDADWRVFGRIGS